VSIIKRLWPDLHELGQCEANREGRYANDGKDTNMRCTHTAKFVVLDRRLCTKHAEVAALRILLEEKS
jgi:hypothetical protein